MLYVVCRAAVTRNHATWRPTPGEAPALDLAGACHIERTSYSAVHRSTTEIHSPIENLVKLFIFQCTFS